MPQLAKMPDLAVLDLSGTRISDKGLRALKPAPGIVDLNLAFAELITDEGTSALRGWKKLKRLNLRGTKITDNTLEAVALVPTLESLDVGFAQLTDAGLDHLTVMANLRELSMGGNKLTDASLQFLRQMPRITALDVSGAQRTDSGLWSLALGEQGIDAIASVTALRELNVSGTAIGLSGLRQLSALPALERLGLQNCTRVGHESVALLAGMRRLKWLDVAGTALTPEDVAAVKAALPQCQILH
jgi:Leucine-rich repeat (LRR) protein